ncbi:hypothetical protein BGX24_000970 [Mortierella sp. AD032]|nr:hypothetical protein BGX24_000970 [Mortierella sp. AD032]
MFLSQEASAVLFTVIRLALQTSSIYLISCLASRTYNLTYLERINGGFFARVNYILFTKSPSHRQQHLGRFYVALALLVSLALTYLPALLSDMYPVEDKFRLETQTPFDLSLRFIKPTNIPPGNTSASNILAAMGLSVAVEGQKFFDYSNPAHPKLGTCQFIDGGWSNATYFAGGDYAWCPQTKTEYNLNKPYGRILALGNDNSISSEPIRANSTHGAFEYYNLTSNRRDPFAPLEMFRRMAFFKDSWSNGPRSLEYCLLRSRLYRNNCARSSIGYLRMFEKQPAIITRRMLWQNIDKSSPKPVDVANCSQFSTTGLRAMCLQVISLPTSNDEGRMFSLQSRTTDDDGGLLYEVITKHITSSESVGIRDSEMFVLEAMSVQTRLVVYDVVVNEAEWQALKASFDLMEFDEQEIFETTNVIRIFGDRPKIPIDWEHHDWSSDDYKNLTDFLLGGTLLNDATLLVRKPELLADVSNLIVILLFGASLLMIVPGFIVSRGIPSMIRDPLTEVLHEVYASSSKNKSSVLGNNKKVPRLSFRNRRVANLLLESQPVQDSETYSSKTESDNPNSLASSIVPMSEMATAAAMSSSPPSNYGRQRRTLILRMELESDDEDDAVELLERKNQDVASSHHIAFHIDE